MAFPIPLTPICIKLGYHSDSERPGSFKYLVKPENLDEEEAYDCATCLSRVPATKTLTLKMAPKVLILVLKRFCDFTGDKIIRVVQYPQCIDMQSYMYHQNT
jgi:ubiquitin carboxyl-terminal hydrolase 17